MRRSDFPSHRDGGPGAVRCSPFSRCAVCRGLRTQLRREFDEMVRGSWNPAEIDILSKAARSALL